MSLQIPSVAQFPPRREPSSVAQHWTKWKKSFQYFLNAPGTTTEVRKKASLLHLVRTETREIFKMLQNTGETFAEALLALDNHFSVKKNIPLQRSKFHQPKQETNESIGQYITKLRQLCLYCDQANASSLKQI